MLVTLPCGRECQHEEFMVLMGFDAFRMARGAAPKTFTRKEVLRWLRIASPPARSVGSASLNAIVEKVKP